MGSPREEAILTLVDSARKQADAFIVVGIMPGSGDADRIFYSVDERVSIPDLHGILQRNLDFICQSVSHFRARRAKEAKSRA